MKDSIIKANVSLDPKTGVEPVSIFSYNSGMASSKNRIALPQNLFSFLLQGEKIVHYAASTAEIKPGQFLLLSAGNCLMSEKIAAESGTYKSILISFDNNVLTDFFSRNPGVMENKPGEIYEEPFLLFEKDHFIDHFVESLGYLLAEGKSISVNMCLVKLHELLLYLSENYPGQLHKLRNMNQGVGDLQVRLAITANMDHPVTVEELAFLCHTSLSTFKRRFAKIYGTSPNKWLLEKKMQKAARLLKQGDYKPSEVYHELGYDNLSSFITSFKQVYGVTPKQYQLSN